MGTGGAFATRLPPSNWFLQVEPAVAAAFPVARSRRFGAVTNAIGGLVCGEANGRNGCGGYPGLGPFAAVPDSESMALRVSNSRESGFQIFRLSQCNEPCLEQPRESWPCTGSSASIIV